MSLTRITEKQMTSAAIKQIRDAFRHRGRRHHRSIGFRSGQESHDLDAIESAGIWLAYMLRQNQHWCAFGTLPIPEKANVPITVEINTAISSLNRKLSGLLAADEAGSIYLCHTGAVRGGKKGVGKNQFLASFDQEPVPVVDLDGRSTLAFPIAEVGSARVVEQISEFVWAVADFKAGRCLPTKAKTNGLFSGSDEEFEGSRRISTPSSYTASCDHGIVRNRLSHLIKETGRKVTRDQHRDILVGELTKPDIEFEIKTSVDPQCIYTAVGQLLLHAAMKPVKRSVAVLPHPVGVSISKAIASLKLEVVSYRWTATHILFDGLESIIPGVCNTAPINRSKI